MGGGCQMSDVRCQMSDFIFHIADVRCQMSDVRCQMPDVRCQISDVRLWIGKNHVFIHLLVMTNLTLKTVPGEPDTAASSTFSYLQWKYSSLFIWKLAGAGGKLWKKGPERSNFKEKKGLFRPKKNKLGLSLRRQKRIFCPKNWPI